MIARPGWNREPVNGHGETMAVSHDEADAAVSAYEKGRADQAAFDDATEDREARWWRIGFALVGVAGVVGLFAIAAALSTLANVAAIK